MATIANIQAVEVVRDIDGSWFHPAIPGDWCESTTLSEMEDWLASHGMECRFGYMCNEVDADAYDAYLLGENQELETMWQPKQPEGEGWFVLYISHCEDDGPICAWVRTQQGRT